MLKVNGLFSHTDTQTENILHLYHEFNMFQYILNSMHYFTILTMEAVPRSCQQCGSFQIGILQT